MPSLPVLQVAEALEKRYYCYGGYRNCGNSAWYLWGRYVVLGGVILLALVIFLSCACMTARRRRARGAQPYYGTGWMAGNHGPVNYYGNTTTTQQSYTGQQQYGNNWGGAPPQYGASADYYAANRQETGVELQSPPATYNSQAGGSYGYQPPPGPPPGKSDVVR